MSDIHTTNTAELLKVIHTRVPHGLFLAREGIKWAAVDNSTGDAWTEIFATRHAAIRWLRRKRM